MTPNAQNEIEKRSATEVARSEEPNITQSYARTRRGRAKQRMKQMQTDVEKLVTASSAPGNDIMQVRLVLQKESDRKMEAEDRRRRADRDKRVEAEKRERAEREHVRKAETEAAEKRRPEDLEVVRQWREDQRQTEVARQTERGKEREEENRRFEERLAFDRSEARQRHKQMMLLLSNLHKQ